MNKEFYPLISRYSGWGSGDEGAHQSGFFTVFAADTSKSAREAFRLNHTDNPIFNLNLKYLNPLTMLTYSGLKSGTPFAYLTTPLCQGVSKAGLRNPFDIRNILMHMEPYFISVTRPAVFVFENVSSLLHENMRPVMNKLMEEVDKWLTEYDVHFMEVDAASFGVPQSRRRFIMYGLRKDLNIEPFSPQISQTKPTVVADIFPDVNGVAYGYALAKTRPASQVGPTMTRTPNLAFVKGGINHGLSKEETNLYCGNAQNWQSAGSLVQHINLAGNSFLAPMSKAIFEPLCQNMEKAGVPKTSIEELLELTAVSSKLSLEMEEESKKKKRA